MCMVIVSILCTKRHCACRKFPTASHKQAKNEMTDERGQTEEKKYIHGLGVTDARIPNEGGRRIDWFLKWGRVGGHG